MADAEGHQAGKKLSLGGLFGQAVLALGAIVLLKALFGPSDSATRDLAIELKTAVKQATAEQQEETRKLAAAIAEQGAALRAQTETIQQLKRTLAERLPGR